MKRIAFVLTGLVGGGLLLNGCEKNEVKTLLRPPAQSPLTVNATCDPDVSVGLVDANGLQAWVLQSKREADVEWRVGANVTSIEIQPKDPTKALPLDVTPKGTGSGNPAKAKVRKDADKDKEFPYKIVLSCQPSAAGSTPVKITIDPDMIIY